MQRVWASLPTVVTYSSALGNLTQTIGILLRPPGDPQDALGMAIVLSVVCVTGGIFEVRRQVTAPIPKSVLELPEVYSRPARRPLTWISSFSPAIFSFAILVSLVWFGRDFFFSPIDVVDIDGTYFRRGGCETGLDERGNTVNYAICSSIASADRQKLFQVSRVGYHQDFSLINRRSNETCQVAKIELVVEAVDEAPKLIERVGEGGIKSAAIWIVELPKTVKAGERYEGKLLTISAEREIGYFDHTFVDLPPRTIQPCRVVVVCEAEARITYSLRAFATTGSWLDMPLDLLPGEVITFYSENSPKLPKGTVGVSAVTPDDQPSPSAEAAPPAPPEEQKTKN